MGAAAGTAGYTATSGFGSFRSNATPIEQQMLLGRLDQAINLRAALCGASDACLYPRLLKDGRYALPMGALGDAHKQPAAAPLLGDWNIESVAHSDFESASPFGTPRDFVFLVDGKFVRQAGRPASLSMPAGSVFRFAVSANDFAGSYDSLNGNRRSEIVSHQSGGVGADSIWTSFCVVLGDLPDVAGAGNAIIHQWHSADTNVGRAPVLYVDISSGELGVYTCSSSNLADESSGDNQPAGSGIPVVQYVTELPEVGARTYFTFYIRFGHDGHLTAWINGLMVADTDTPIGYYDDLIDGSGRTILGYPHWGLYTNNKPNTNVVYVANPEWGKSSLLERVSAPLSVPDLLQ